MIFINQSVFANGTIAIANKGDGTASFINLSDGSINVVSVGFLPHEITASKTHAYVSNYGKQHVRSKSIKDKPGNSLSVIDLKNYTLTETISLGPKICAPHGLYTATNAHKLYVTCEAREEILVIDTITNRIIKAIPTHQAGSHMITVNPQNTKAYVTNFWIGTVSVIDLIQNKLSSQITLGRGLEGITISPDGRYLFVTTVEDHKVIKVDTTTNKVVHTIQLAKRTSPIRLLITPDGKKLIGNNAGKGTFSIYSTSDLSLITEIKVGKLPIGLTMSTDGNFAYVANMKSSTLSIININKGFITDEIKTNSTSPDGIVFID